MELNRYKEDLNRRLEDGGAYRRATSVKSVRATRSSLRRLRRNLDIESVLYVLSMALVIVAPFKGWAPLSWVYFGITLPTMSFFLVFIRRLARRIDRHLASSGSLHEGISSLVGLMKSYASHYLLLTVLLVPPYFFICMLLGLQEVDEVRMDLPFWGLSGKAWMLILGLMLVLAVVNWYFTKWYISWLYGRHIRQLEADLRELEADEDAPADLG